MGKLKHIAGVNIKPYYTSCTHCLEHNLAYRKKYQNKFRQHMRMTSYDGFYSQRLYELCYWRTNTKHNLVDDIAEVKKNLFAAVNNVRNVPNELLNRLKNVLHNYRERVQYDIKIACTQCKQLAKIQCGKCFNFPYCLNCYEKKFKANAADKLETNGLDGLKVVCSLCLEEHIFYTPAPWVYFGDEKEYFEALQEVKFFFFSFFKS